MAKKKKTKPEKIKKVPNQKEGDQKKAVMSFGKALDILAGKKKK